ncbi:MAG: alpha/beta fold hydrolase [Alphaproteobacteria bacterium]|nr:alpha/beta fold hydrolase [Alphaproteobacteria bacterium]
METSVSFMSDGLKLAGVMHTPDDMKPGEKRAALLVLHGFGTSKDGSTPEIMANMFCDWGYVALRFDFRSCGDSEGERGLVRCLDQVEDTKNAVTWIGEQEGIDPQRIGVIGHSFGAAVAVYAGGVDERIAAVISSCGWGDGDTKFQLQHLGDDWTKFTDALAEGKRRRDAGEPDLRMSRWDIVPIPEHLRGNMGANVIMDFPSETAQSMFDFRANDVVGKIAPRPLLLFHASDDSVTPTDQSLQLFAHAGQPTDLLLLSGVDHFPFSIGNDRPRTALLDWLKTYFPA